MQKYLNILFLASFIGMVLGRAAVMRRRGIKALLFGVSDKSDFLLMPVVAFFLYSICAATFDLPIPELLVRPFVKNSAVSWAGTVVCAVSLVWFALALKSFGDSFRVGIDENSPGKLVTTGMFAVSRNPIYVAFLAFFIGMLLVFFNLSLVISFVLFFGAIHRQILREEKFLKSHYGKEYEDYCARVRRYL